MLYPDVPAPVFGVDKCLKLGVGFTSFLNSAYVFITFILYPSFFPFFASSVSEKRNSKKKGIEKPKTKNTEQAFKATYK